MIVHLSLTHIYRHAAHTDILRHAIVCALDLGNKPSNADDRVIVLHVRIKPDHAELPPRHKFRPLSGHTLTFKQAGEKFEGAYNVLLSNLSGHEKMKKKGGLGVAPLILIVPEGREFARITLPSQDGAKLMQKDMDWGQKNWVRLSWSTECLIHAEHMQQVTGLNVAFELGYAREVAGTISSAESYY